METAHAPVLAPGALPLLGHALALSAPLRFLRSLPAHGDLVEVRVGPLRAVVVCDPALTHQVLLNDRVFDKGGLVLKRGREIAGNGLGTCAHRDHRRQRRLVQPAFHRHRMPHYASVMVRQASEVMNAWRPGQIIDVLDEMGTVSIRSIAAAVSAALPPGRADSLIADYFSLEQVLYRRMLTPPPFDRLPTPGKRRYDRARARLQQTVQEIIAVHREGKPDRGDLMSMLLLARVAPSDTDDGRRLSDREVSDQIVSFFLAGAKTVAETLSWSAHLVATHPEVRQRLHAEVDTVMSASVPLYGDLHRLKTTENIVKETLRLYPAAALTRTTTTATELGRYRLRAGTTVVYSPYLLHRHPGLFPDPEHFRPERWLSIPAADARAVYLPFAAGPRKCIGDTFGFMECTLVLAMLAARWQLEPVGDSDSSPVFGATLRPRRLRMRLIARTGTEDEPPASPA
ncbi:cytochrome P450 [Streptomyces sp. YIM 121038]|uniref:cytochrome P450 n=1 Tax=Streptomyces sp. YIM 121038 TaxID=2136401 RepID=UPI0011104562|nr:cytochrome P450 [Streptomyces sp. YIM 121038]